MASFTLVEGIFYYYRRHFRLQKGGRWVEDKNPLPPSEIPLYTMVSGTLVEDGREIKENVERITNKETVSRKTNKKKVKSSKNEYLSYEKCIFARKRAKYALFAIFLWLSE